MKASMIRTVSIFSKTVISSTLTDSILISKAEIKMVDFMTQRLASTKLHFQTEIPRARSRSIRARNQKSIINSRMTVLLPRRNQR